MKDEQRYNAIQNVDDQYDSSTEVEDWGIEHDSKRESRKTLLAKVRVWRWLVDTTLLLVIVALLLEKKWKQQRSYTYELAGDITGFAPQFSQRIVSFKPNQTFAPEDAEQFWSNETQHAWLNIVPGTRDGSFEDANILTNHERVWDTSMSIILRSSTISHVQYTITPITLYTRRR